MMAGTVVLTLDTAAPVVEWGAITGNAPGQLLQVAYTSDEPFDHGELELPDGRRLALTIWPTRVEALLPVDTTGGIAYLRVVDDVGNQTEAHGLALEGAVPPEPAPTPVPGLPGKRPRVAPSKRRWLSRVALRTGYRVTSTVRAQSRAGLRTSYEVDAPEIRPGPGQAPPSPPSPRSHPPQPPESRSVVTHSRIVLRSSWKSQQPWTVPTSSRVGVRWQYRTERDDSGEVALLVALEVV